MNSTSQNLEPLAQDWGRLYTQLVRVADQRIQGKLRRDDDGHDVATSVIKSYLGRAARGEVPRVRDEQHLWRLLVRMVVHKVIDRFRKMNRLKNGGGRIVSESGLGGSSGEGGTIGLDQVAVDSSSAEYAALLNEEMERLKNEQHRKVARLYMEGYTLEEIAGQLGVSIATVHRNLKCVRSRWQEDLQ